MTAGTLKNHLGLPRQINQQPVWFNVAFSPTAPFPFEEVVP